MKRIGLIGFGFIGQQVYRRILAEPQWGLEIAFVHARDPAKLPAAHALPDLSGFAATRPDLVVEMAHPAYSRDWGARILTTCTYLPLSVTALADDVLRETLLAAATAAGTRLAIPHGALMGLDSLHEWRAGWEAVTITFRKNPANIDFSDSGIDPAGIHGETVLYGGPARGIAGLFPRNVNTMVTCALATTGLDACRARLVAVPGLDVAIAEVEARGHDGGILTMRRAQPAIGVSGTEMFESQFASIMRAAGAQVTLSFV